MPSYLIEKVRRQLSADGSHRHISGVVTAAGLHHSREEVVASINVGNLWQVNVDGHLEAIVTSPNCPQPHCSTGPYLTAQSTRSGVNILEILREG
jgi:hypothetical protein